MNGRAISLFQSCVPVLFKGNVSIIVSFGSSNPLLVVRDYAAEEVGVGVPECGHQFGERLLVKLSDGSEHPLLCLQTCCSECDRPAAVS